VAVSFFLSGIVSPVGPMHLTKGASGLSKDSIEVAERSLSGVGEKRLHPATRPNTQRGLLYETAE
jgi:hypothetical protein